MTRSMRLFGSSKSINSSVRLYHVSDDLYHNGIFIPSVPELLEDGDDEDNQIPRICFSDSISGCLGSMPYGGRGLEYFSSVDCGRGYYKVFFEDFKSEELLWTPSALESLVPDARLHNEYWITRNLDLSCKYFFMKLINFSCDDHTNVISNLEYKTQYLEVGDNIIFHFKEQEEINDFINFSLQFPVECKQADFSVNMKILHNFDATQIYIRHSRQKRIKPLVN